MSKIDSMIRDIICWEDPDSFPIIALNEDGKIVITDCEWYNVFEADTFEEALTKFWEFWKSTSYS